MTEGTWTPQHRQWQDDYMRPHQAALALGGTSEDVDLFIRRGILRLHLRLGRYPYVRRDAVSELAGLGIGLLRRAAATRTP